MRKIVFTTVTLTLLCLMLYSCGGKTVTPGTMADETEKTPADTAVSPSEVKINYGKFTIISKETGNDPYTEDTVVMLSDNLKRRTGKQLKRDSHRAPEQDFEMIVGDTKRSQSGEFLSRLAANEYGFTVRGNKIVIAGHTALTSRFAVQCFNTNTVGHLKKGDDGEFYFNFEDGYTMVKTYDGYKVDMPVFDGKADGVYDCGDSCYMTVYKSVGAKAFDAYTANVKDAGFVTVNENRIGGNRYMTSTKGDAMIHFYYIAAADEMRIVYGKNDIITPLFNGGKGGNVRENCTLMPMSYTQASGGGQCIIYTLSDGTFFVMDGGWSGEADTLYSTLTALNADANGEGAPIVISAWFLSHGHIDHTGCIYKFASSYGSKVKVNALICNNASDVQMSTSAIYTHMETGNLTTNVLSYMKDSDGNRTKLMKLHTGQKLTLGGETFDVLFTHEDLFGTVVKNFNDLCTVILADVGKTKFFLTADASNVELPALIKEVPNDYIRCEFCQVGHHGADRGYQPLYPIVGAPYYLYPNSHKDYTRDLEQNKYSWVTYVVDNAKELYLAEGNCYTFDLPYTAGSAIEWNFADQKPSDIRNKR